jgi:hypothetical protein
MMMVTPGNGTALQSRSSSGGQSTNNNNLAGPKAPYWVRLVRTGNTLTGYRSADGVSWTQQASVTIAMARTVYVGLAVVPGDNTTLATVTFSNVTLSNSAPTVAGAATANPSTVTGVSTDLSVLGADDHGEPNLSYTWSATMLPEGASDPTFSDNGTNAARGVTATFSHAGTYVLTARIADTAGMSVTSSVTVVVEPVLTRVVLTPASPVRVAPGGAVPFAAAALDQFGDSLGGAAPQFTWSATGGTIGDDGLYAAPLEPGTYLVSASAGGAGASADVVVALPDVTAPTLRSVVSRKAHGTRGDFDLPLSLSAAPGSATVEPRLGGPTTLRFIFDEPVVAEDGTLDATEFLIDGASLGSAQLDPSGTILTLTLTGVQDRTTVAVTIGGFADLAGNALVGDSDVSVRALAGDVNGNGVVNEMDFLLARRALFRPLSDQTFLADIDLDGSVDSFDLLHVRRNDGDTVL